MLKEDIYITEEETIRKLADGSTEAFDTIYYRYYEPVRANIFKIVRDDAVADDILQEVFISLWNKRTQFAGYRTINGWLFVASYNRSINVLRRQATERLYQRSMHDAGTYAEDPAAERIQEQQFRLVEEAISQLSPQRKRIFELCRLQGKTYEQAAEELAISKNTVKDHLTKASDAIRAYVLRHKDDSQAVSACILLVLAGDIIFL